MAQEIGLVAAYARDGFRRIASLIRRGSSATPWRTLVDLAGLALVALGVALIYVPAGVITAGLAVCFVNYATQVPVRGDSP